ncbi:MAG: universal stress protein [Acidimicrobiales bacterium]|jgi:nucleotide-binding universal stress UspA family protein
MADQAKRVVVGIDGSDASVEALRWAAGYASETGAKVVALRAWHYPWAMQTAPQQVDQTVTSQVAGELKDAISRAGVAADVEPLVKEGHASIVLVKESEHADLLVVGLHGHSAVHDLLLGSVSLHCVSRSVCPVVVVRQK